MTRSELGASSGLTDSFRNTVRLHERGMRLPLWHAPEIGTVGILVARSARAQARARGLAACRADSARHEPGAGAPFLLSSDCKPCLPPYPPDTGKRVLAHGRGVREPGETRLERLAPRAVSQSAERHEVRSPSLASPCVREGSSALYFRPFGGSWLAMASLVSSSFPSSYLCLSYLSVIRQDGSDRMRRLNATSTVGASRRGSG